LTDPKKTASKMTRADLEALHGFLLKYPTLGLEHPFGRAISERVKQIQTVTLNPGVWFRGLVCRNRTPDPQDFLPPDPCRIMVPEQRFNHQGQRVFYLSNSERGAALECRDDEDDHRNVWIQRLHASTLRNIIDLTSAESNDHVVIEAAMYCADVTDDVKRPSHLQPEYFVPRFLADCARLAGAAGLLVPSVEEGTNLVLFRWDDDQIHAEGKPQRFQSR
jgi:RES domain-containing protein